MSTDFPEYSNERRGPGRPPKPMLPQSDASPDAAPEQHVNRPRERRKFGAFQFRLSAPDRPGFRRYWARDTGDRVTFLRERGYEVVKDETTGKPITKTGGKQENGSIMMMVLMEIPQEFADEDFAAKQEMLNETDKAIYSGKHNEEAGERRYIPSASSIKERVMGHSFGR